MRKIIKNAQKINDKLLGPVILVICLISVAWLDVFFEKRVKENDFSPSCSKKGVVMLEKSPLNLDNCNNVEKYLLGQKMDLNKVNKQELMLLPNIGPAYADSILTAYQAVGKPGPVIFGDLVPGLSKQSRESLQKWTY
jgi:hypothetical protein